MKKPKFNIGDYVEAIPCIIDYVGDSKYQYNKELIRYNFKKVKGVIVGACWKYEGCSVFEGHDEGWIFIKGKGHLLWQIREGYINRPICALEKDINLLISINSQCIDILENNRQNKSIIPWSKSGMTDEMKKVLSEEMKLLHKKYPYEFPRDKNGRFIRGE